MQNLLDFLYRFRTFGLFLVLEVLSVWLILRYNNYYNASFLNSSNSFVASIIHFSDNTTKYFNLAEINQKLLEENRQLREELSNAARGTVGLDTLRDQYVLVKSEVINYTFRRSTNYLTLKAGTNEGIAPGMGVISKNGVAGQVKSVSGGYATVTSLLHPKLLVSSEIKSTSTLCTVQWDGKSPLTAEIKFVPRHINFSAGDTVVTSGFNSVFPPGILLGTVASVDLAPQDAFYTASLDLATDFTSLDYVYVVRNEFKTEIDSLEQSIERK